MLTRPDFKELLSLLEKHKVHYLMVGGYKMREDKTQINPPLFLAYTVIGCWRCGGDMPALALVAPNVPDERGESCILSEVEELPAAVYDFVRTRFPSYQLKHSKTSEFEYYANTCPNCGVLSGDFFLHAEPGAPFFPTTREEAKELTLELIPLKDPIWVRAGYWMGVADLILKHAKKEAPEQPASTGRSTSHQRFSEKEPKSFQNALSRGE